MTRVATAEEALQRLSAGNQRFVADKRDYPNQTPGDRLILVAGQHPFAAILGCADSRVPPEIIFDQGLGQLFTVRVAGHIADGVVLGSLEYAVEHLGVPLIVVLGHSRCGAVQAAIAGGANAGNIATLVTAIQPAIALARAEPGELLDNAVRANVVLAVRQLRAAARILAAEEAAGNLKVCGALYDLATGQVDWLPSEAPSDLILH